MQLPSFLKWPFSARARQGALGVGVSLFPDKIAIAVVDHSPKKPIIKFHDIFEITGDDFWGLLCSKIEQYDLKKKQICFVLSREQYGLQLVEAPQVELSEMRQAMHWRLKELVTFPVEEAIYDLFPLYETPPRGRPQLLYLVTANRSALAPLYEFVENNNIDVQAFDIQEMALRNLLALTTDKKESVALLQLAQDEGHLTIFQHGRLFLCRLLPQGYNLLEQNKEAMWEELLLEIQRSFDYYETRFMQHPVSHLFVQREGDAMENIVERIQERISAKVEALSLPSLFTDETSQIQWSNCLACALGAALRGKLEQ